MSALAPISAGEFLLVLELEKDGWREILRSQNFVALRKDGRPRPVTVQIDGELWEDTLREKLSNAGMTLERYSDIRYELAQPGN